MYKQKKFLLVCFMFFCLSIFCFGTKSAQATESEIEEPPIAEEENHLSDMSKYVTGEGVTLLGDSIMNGNRKIILEQLPDALIDAKGSRDVVGGFEAGTNEPLLKYEPYATGTQNLLELLGTERQIFWVTVYCSYSQWMKMNNEYIWELAATRPNITVIDWYSLAVEHPEWFPDGVHPNMDGAKNFAKLLREALEAKYGAK